MSISMRRSCEPEFDLNRPHRGRRRYGPATATSHLRIIRGLPLSAGLPTRKVLPIAIHPMTPGELASAIRESFDTFEGFTAQMEQAALNMQGSGCRSSCRISVGRAERRRERLVYT